MAQLDPKFSAIPSFFGAFSNVLHGDDPIQFHFDCSALCKIGLDEDGEVDSFRILGFWLTSEEADLAARGRESRLRAEHEAQYKVTDGRWPAWPWDNPGYKPNHYEIVPLSSVRFDDLIDLDSAVEAVAKARLAGIGVETAQAAQIGGIQ
jgi:hypothetical protein